MERKYRQRGYMDSGREAQEERPKPRPETFGPKTPKLAPTHSVGQVPPVRFRIALLQAVRLFRFFQPL